MANTVSWRGASGQQYAYSVHDITWVPSADPDGNYIFAKNVNGSWHAVYVGQGDLQSRRAAAIDEGCVTRKGATHFHCHRNGDQNSRLMEEADIIKGNPETVTPVGCNGQ